MGFLDCHLFHDQGLTHNVHQAMCEIAADRASKLSSELLL